MIGAGTPWGRTQLIMDGSEACTDVVLVNRYRLHELLGKGGMGSVWRAHDELLGRTVAVKQVRLAGLPDVQAEAARLRTLREARIAASLHHPNVVTVFDVVTAGNNATGHDEPWLILEYVPSRTLADVLRDDGPMVPAAVAANGAQVAAALSAAHAKSIVHRDVKPGNVLLVSPSSGRPPEVKLTDFGIAHAPGAADITGTGAVSGTPAYFAPETARAGMTDARSDVYSLGATLYEAVEGHPPFGRVASERARVAAPHRRRADPAAWLRRPSRRRAPADARGRSYAAADRSRSRTIADPDRDRTTRRGTDQRGGHL